MISIKATQASEAPKWAVLQRRLFGVMEKAAKLTIEKYTDDEGIPYFADDVDDLYERFYNWPLFYSMGASGDMLKLSVQEYEVITDSNGDHTQNPHYPWLFPQLHNEYYSLKVPEGQAPSWIPGQRIITDWHHMGEGNQLFYGIGMVDPNTPQHLARSERFAAMMIGEDPEAQNYDHDLNQFRSVYTDARGPIYEVNVEQAKGFMHGGSPTQPNWKPKPMGTRVSLYPVVKALEVNWHDSPKRAGQILDTFNKLIMPGDIPHNMGATALVTNAYMHTGDDRYKQWVLRYVEGWLDRMKKNGGIMPDNIGPTGKVGEHREGQWWGGWYGWGCYKGNDIGLTSMTVGAECAHLLTGDDQYLDVIRSQMKVLFENSMTLDDGQQVFSWRYSPDGWFDYKPMPIKWLPHLYHASMGDDDRQMMEQVREGDVERQWGEASAIYAKAGGDAAFFHYHDGKFPDWPEKLMESELERADEALDKVRAESRDPSQMIADNSGIPNPVSTETLTQMMLGSPGTVYNGGLLRATIRYFDADAKRASLPADVSALVDQLGPNVVGFQLVNLSRSETRRIIVQAGAFGEHQFTTATHEGTTSTVESKYIEVTLPAGASVQVKCGLNRFVNQPSYAMPW
jgi:hypothetical protein